MRFSAEYEGRYEMLKKKEVYNATCNIIVLPTVQKFNYYCEVGFTIAHFFN